MKELDVLLDRIKPITQVLRSAAINNGTIGYAKIYSMFPKDTHQNAIWNTFEAACEILAHNNDAIYGALLSKKNSGLPELGFFDIYRNTRRLEYLSIVDVNSNSIHDLSEDEQRLIVETERARVYDHARSNA